MWSLDNQNPKLALGGIINIKLLFIIIGLLSSIAGGLAFYEHTACQQGQVASQPQWTDQQKRAIDSATSFAPKKHKGSPIP